MFVHCYSSPGRIGLELYGEEVSKRKQLFNFEKTEYLTTREGIGKHLEIFEEIRNKTIGKSVNLPWN